MKEEIKKLNEQLLKLESELESLKDAAKEIPQETEDEDGNKIPNPQYKESQKAIIQKRGEIDQVQVMLENAERVMREEGYFNVENKEHPLGQIIDFLAKNELDAREYLHLSQDRVSAILEGSSKPSRKEKALILVRVGVKYDVIKDGKSLLSQKPRVIKRTHKLRYLDKYLRLKHGLTLARAIAIPDQKWAMYESGNVIPSDKVMKNAANYFMLPNAMLLMDHVALPSFDELTIDEDLASIQRKDLSVAQNKVRNKGYIRRNFRVLDSKTRTKMITSLLMILVPLGIYTGYCSSRVLTSRTESRNSMSRDGDAIRRDNIANADDITKSVYNDYSPAVNKDGAAIVKVGADITKIADIEPSAEHFTSNMSLWFDFDQVAFHKMYSAHRGKASAWSTPKPKRPAATNSSILQMEFDTFTMLKDTSSSTTFKATLGDSRYSDTSMYEVVWSTSDIDIAGVMPDVPSSGSLERYCSVTAYEAGNVTISAELRASSSGSVIATASTDVIVEDPIRFTSENVTLTTGDEADVSVELASLLDLSKPEYEIDWNVNQRDRYIDFTCDSKDKTGKITAVKAGSGTITASVKNSRGLSYGLASLSFTVNPGNPIKFDDLTTDVNLGKTSNITIKIDPSYTQAKYTVNWTSSNPEVAAVNGTWNSAVISALTIGQTTITAELIDLANGTTVARASVRCVVSSGTATNPMPIYDDDFNKSYMDDFTVDPESGNVAWGGDGNLDYIQLNHPRQLHNYVAQYVNDLGEGEASTYATRNKAIRAASAEELDTINDIWVSERKAYPGLYGSNVYSDYLRNFDIGKGIEYDSLSYMADPGIHYYLTTDQNDADPSERTFRVFQHLTFRVKVFKAYDNPRYPLESAEFNMSVVPAEWMSVDKVIYDLSTTIDLTKEQISGLKDASGHKYVYCSADDGVFKNLSSQTEFTNGFRRLRAPYKSAVNLIEYNVNKNDTALSHSKLSIVCRANRDAFTLTSFLPMSFATSYINLFAVIVWIIIAFYNQSHNGEDSLGMLGTGMFSAISATIVGLQMVSDASMFSLMTMINIFTLVVILIMTWQAVMAKRANAMKDKALIAYNGVKLRIMFYALLVATVIVFVGLPLMSYMFMF